MFAPRFNSALILLALLLSSCLGSAPKYFEGPLNISFAESPTSLSPLSYSAQNRRLLTQIYEPLLSLDAEFNLRTALAVSWGRLDDTTWELRLRKGVTFHDGRALTAEDVVYSLNLARAGESEMAPLLASIESVSTPREERVHLVTREADPLLLQKLSNVLIFPKDYATFEIPMGTGPYRLTKFTDSGYELERYDGYWGPLPFFKNLSLRFVEDPAQRFLEFQNGEVQLLGNLPPQFAEQVQAPSEVVSYPGLELSSLMLNVAHLPDAEIRRAITLALDNDYSRSLGSGYLQPTHQLATTGLLGYNPDFEAPETGLALALGVLKGRSDLPHLKVYLPEGLESLGDLILTDLQEAGFSGTLSFFPIDEYENKILSGEPDLYFFGWKYDLGDMADFMESTAHSRVGSFGAFNGMNYSNPQVDVLLDQARVNFDPDERVDLLHQAQDLILNDHVILPLFEAQGLYAVRPEIQWEPRLDSQILASEILGNLLE